MRFDEATCLPLCMRLRRSMGVLPVVIHTPARVLENTSFSSIRPWPFSCCINKVTYYLMTSHADSISMHNRSNIVMQYFIQCRVPIDISQLDLRSCQGFAWWIIFKDIFNVQPLLSPLLAIHSSHKMIYYHMILAFINSLQQCYLIHEIVYPRTE